MRTFIAIELSEEMHDALAQIQKRLRYSGADVKWVATGNIHLTLKFLGEISEETSDTVRSILDKIAASTKPFEISLHNIGAFPKIDYPRVIWAGIDKGSKESAILANSIDKELSNIGFDKETRPFAAHLTLGRVRSAKNKEALKEKMLTTSLQENSIVTQTAGSIILFKSTLTPTGSIYTKLHEAKFVDV